MREEEGGKADAAHALAEGPGHLVGNCEADGEKDQGEERGGEEGGGDAAGPGEDGGGGEEEHGQDHDDAQGACAQEKDKGEQGEEEGVPAGGAEAGQFGGGGGLGQEEPAPPEEGARKAATSRIGAAIWAVLQETATSMPVKRFWRSATCWPALAMMRKERERPPM